MAEKVELLVRIQLTRDTDAPDRTAARVAEDVAFELESHGDFEIGDDEGDLSVYVVNDVLAVAHKASHTKMPLS